MRNLLSLSNPRTQLSTDRGQVKAVGGLDLTAGEGKTVRLVGESGSGKSATMLSAMGLIDDPGKVVPGSVELESGRLAEESREEYNNPAFVDGDVVNLVDAPEEVLRAVRGRELDMIFRDPMALLNPSLTVDEQVTESLRPHQYGGRRKDSWFNAIHELLPRISCGIDDETVERTIEVLESVGVLESDARIDEFPHEFSGEMHQHVLIAIAFACQPRMLIAGEPTTALDVTIQMQTLDLVDDFQEDFSTSVLVTTHDLSVVVGMCDQVAVMYVGEIVEERSVEGVFHNPSHSYTYTLTEPLPGEDKERLVPIEGSVPDLIDIPEGCHFTLRCPWAQPECISGEIPYRQHGDGEVDRRLKCVLGDFGTNEHGGGTIEVPTGIEPSDMPLLEVDGMQKYHGQANGILDQFFGADDRSVKVVDGADLTVYEGETLGLAGEPGCEESTAGRSLLHLTPPTGGRIVFSRTSLSGLDNGKLRAMRRDMQMISQDPMSSLDPRMTVGQAIREPLDVHDLPESDLNMRGEADVTVTDTDAERVSVTMSDEIDAIVGSLNGVATVAMTVTIADGEVDVAVEERLRTEVEVEHEDDAVSGVTVCVTSGDSISEHRRRWVRQLLDVVGLGSDQCDRYPHEPSGDQCQRVGIAHTLAVDPDLIVADESVSVLDVSVQAQILSLLEDLQERFGLTYLFIAHNLSVVRCISDRVVVMYLGEIVEVATTDELFDDPERPYTQVSLSATPEPDPAAGTDGRIILEGDMPSPINSPSGCHLRMRCPQVIPPADLDIERTVYRRVTDSRQYVEREALDAEAAHDAAPSAGDPGAEAAASADGGTTDATVDELHESHLSHSLSPELRGVVDHALGRVVADDWDETGEILHERFESVCEHDTPELGEQTHLATCYSVDEQTTSKPRCGISPVVRRF